MKNIRKFIFPLTGDVQVVIEAMTFSEAWEEYDQIRDEVNLEKIKIIQRPIKKSVKRGIYDYLLEIKDAGFFLEERTIGNIKNKLAELTIHCETSSLPPYLNKLIQENILKRTKGIKEGKEVWLYKGEIENGNK